MSSNYGKLLLLTLCLMLLASMALAEKGRIYGKIYTRFGDVYEGPIRWDKNEVGWEDMLDGTKERDKYRDDDNRRRKYREKSGVKLFGITITDGETWYSSSAQVSIAFGFIKKITPDSDNSAEIMFKNGEEVHVKSGSTDLGSSMRELVIEDKNEGEIEFDWDDIDYVEFFEGPSSMTSDLGTRIYGTVTTDRAGEYTGWITWDVDEALTEDIIDGREQNRKRKIKFEQIQSIEKISSQASEVTTKNGKKMRLDDSNDVDSGNRGIAISDSKLGRVDVDWDEFEKLEIKDPPASAFATYDDFKGGERLYGTVYDEDGEAFTGYIRWDNDEEYGWEVIDGEYRSVDFDFVLANIKSIEKLSRRSSRVTLWDGRDFRLRESNDINDDNKGIYVYPDGKDGDEVIIDWDDFDRVEFKKQ
ncbi:MAG: hypothetical protein R3F48_09620 [Candidatus Zixiibacteriota bacterium]